MKGRRGGIGSRAVVVGNGTVAVVLVGFLAAIALFVRPPAPPGIAEFAPQAARPITEAPVQQSSRFGSGNATGCAAAQACGTRGHVASPAALSSPAAPSSGVPSALQCYTWPDGTVTQTFDPQSPPCIASWDASSSNGGASSQGVTAATIRIADPMGARYRGLFDPLVAFVNSRYQLWGRHLVVDYATERSGTRSGPSVTRAQALGIAQRKPFAVIDGVGSANNEDVFNVTLAEHEIVVVNRTTPVTLTGAALAKYAPFLWAVNPPLDVLEASAGALACRALHGHRAEYGGAKLNQQQRSFVLAYDDPQGRRPPPTEPLLARLRGCGAHVRVVVLPADEAPRTQTFTELALGDWTTVLWLDDTNVLGLIPAMTTATKAGYQPEWFSVGFPGWISPENMQVNATEGQRDHLFGLWPDNRSLPPATAHAERAFADGGGSPDDLRAAPDHSLPAIYAGLALLAAGIQTAGPQLTPDRFASGLRVTHFPNPGAGGPPYFQARVGLGEDSVFHEDVALAWWSDAAGDASNRFGPGGLCFLDRGQRWTESGWPRSVRFDRTHCD